MGHFKLLIGLLLICIQNGCSIPINESEKGVQYIYSYNGTNDAASNACNYRFSRWSLLGNLTIQVFDKYWIYQLQDVKTGLYNGYLEDLNYTTYNDIPKEAEVLTKPFVLNKEDSTIFVESYEPLWSVNFKRGLASNFHKTEIGTHNEKLIFGDCETITESNENGTIIKSINHKSCKGVPYKHRTNVNPAPGSKKFDPIIRDTSYIILKLENDSNMPKKVDAVSTITYKSMPKVPYNQFISQRAEFNFQSKSNEFERINIESLEVNTEIYFKYGEEATQGRHKYETDPKVLTKQFFENYDKFEKQFSRRPIENRKNTTEDFIENMFLALWDMSSVDDIKNLYLEVKEKSNWNLYSSFNSLIPYIGTDSAVKFIYDEILKLNLNSYNFYAIRILATFPQYILHPTNELVQSLEGLADVEDDVVLGIMRNSRVLSFASVVAKSNKEGLLSEQNFEKYTNMYNEKFLGNENYKNRMPYLLGLINLADGLSEDFMTSIITNTSLPANLRSLALAGFKENLKKGDPEKLFGTFWELVQNKKENFDLRTEALDLLLFSNISEGSFKIILSEINKMILSDDIYNQHLANYFITSLESLQNSTAYVDPLSNIATETLTKENIRIRNRPWMTGNYRVSYSDPEPNLGGYFHTRLIANPITNAPSTIQLSFNQFAWSFDTGVYSVYLKVQGLSEYIFRNTFFKHINEKTAIPEVLELIKDLPKKDEMPDFHIEVVLFIDKRAVFTANLDKQIMYSWLPFLVYHHRQRMISNTFIITYPLMDYIQMPSLVGSPVSIKNDMQDIMSLKTDNNDLIYRSSWYYQTWLESYNPILDTTVSSFKYHGDEKSIDAKFPFNPQRPVLTWTNKKNSFNYVTDELIGTNVDNDQALKKHCSICDEVLEIPTQLYSQERLKDLDMFGVRFNYSLEQYEEPFTGSDDDDVFEEFMYQDIHRCNSDSYPYLKPMLTLIHLYRHMHYLKPRIRRVYYYSIPTHENGTQTMIYSKKSSNESETQDPFEDLNKQFTLYIVTKSLEENDYNYDENYLNHFELHYEYSYDHNYVDENGKEKLKFTQNFYSINKNENKEGHQFCITREELLPMVKINKFNILPPEVTTAKTIIRHDKMDNETDVEWKHCSNNRSVTLTEELNNYEDKNKALKESSDYTQCVQQSKGFKYTPPTKNCLVAFEDASRYDQYTIHANLENISDQIDFDYQKYPIFVINRLDDYYIKFQNALPSFAIATNETFFNITSYFPYKIRNPSADIFKDHDVISGIKRTCTITPTEITTFVGRHLQNNEIEEQIGFSECIEEARRGLIFEKIGDNKIGFKFWSNINIIEANIENGKLKVILNNKLLTDSHLNNNISIRFLGDDVILVADDKIIVYYNTEYIYIKTPTLYTDLLCGVCTQI